MLDSWKALTLTKINLQRAWMMENINPYKDIRLHSHYRYSIADITDMTGITKTAIIRTEQGLYTRPPDRLTDVMVEIDGACSREQLLGGYYMWQRAHRRLSHNNLVRALRIMDTPIAGIAPWNRFMMRAFPGSSQIERAKKLCCHQATLMRYESGAGRSMPPQIVVALRDAGIDNEDIKKLDQLGQAYFYEHRAIA